MCIYIYIYIYIYNMEHVITIQQKVHNSHYILPLHFKIERNHLNTSVCFPGVRVDYFPHEAMALEHNLFRAFRGLRQQKPWKFAATAL